MNKNRLRKVLWGLSGSNAVIGELRSQLKELESLKSYNQNLQTEVIDHAEKNKTLLNHIANQTLYIAGLNRQQVGEELARVFDRDKTQRSIFVIGTHDYGNIGDLAITYAETAFLNEHFTDTPVFVISRVTLLANWQRIVSTITDNDVIVLHGGGNMGDIWIREEQARRQILAAFPKNKIVSFPQSIKFYDEKEIKKSAEAYEKHGNFMLVVRDDPSFDFAKEHFSKAHIVRSEDIVFNYEFAAPDFGGFDGVVFAMRDDIEKRADSGIEKFRDAVAEKYDIHVTDTVVPWMEFTSVEYGAHLVYSKINEFYNSSLVVTDRLHGAVFALLAGRPVIVFDNNYGKVRGALKTIMKTHSDRILFANDDGSNVTIEDVARLIEIGLEKKVPGRVLTEEFVGLSKEIRKFIDTTSDR